MSRGSGWRWVELVARVIWIMVLAVIAFELCKLGHK
jgi:hypothetical protein